MGENGKVREVTDQDFATEVLGADGLAIVDFWAVWCGPCRIIAPHMEALAKDYGEKGVHVAKLDVDHNPEVSSRYAVRSIPTVLFFKNGEIVDRVVGAVPKQQLEQKVLQHLPPQQTQQ